METNKMIPLGGAKIGRGVDAFRVFVLGFLGF
jgi:hypothetical protein